MSKAFLIFLAVTVGGLIFGAEAQADPAEYAGSSADGSKVFFTTTAKLVPGDTDNGFRDVYERFEDTAPGIETYVTREISTGPTGGNDAYNVEFDGVSSDGTKVFFSTAESLVAEDEDRSTDVYMRNTSTGATTLVSQGASTCAPICGNGPDAATYVGSTPSGNKVFFTTNEGLAAGDSDEARDIYMRDLGAGPATTALVSRPDSVCAGCGSDAPVTFQGVSADGTKVVFESTDKLAEGDADGGEVDIYERDLTASTTSLVSPAGTCTLAAVECLPIYRALSDDGTKVFLLTKSRLTSADHDNAQDLYQWSSTTQAATLLSTSNEAEEGNGSADAIYVGSSPDGSEAFFETDEKLVGADEDETFDLYERAGATTTLVSVGTAKPVTFNRVSADGGTVLFSTTESLSPKDEGEKLDVYGWSGAAPALMSAGSPSSDSSFTGASLDASKVFYSTIAQLSSADKDENSDIYEGPGTPVLISTGPAGGNGTYIPHLAAVSDSGAHAFFTTRERLTVDDNFAAEQDVYDRSSGGTLLVSVANSGELELGPPAPGLTGTNPASPGTSTEPNILGEAEPGAGIKIYATPDCSGAPVGINTADVDGKFAVPVTVAAGSTTTFRATATNGSGDSSGCSVSSVIYRQESSTPPPGEEGSGRVAGGGGDSGGAGSSGGATGGSSGGAGGSVVSTGGAGGGIKIGGIVYVAPITRITFGPASKTRSPRPVFRFIDAIEQPGTRFVCKVDRKAWKGCVSPYRLPRLKPGRHSFAVKGRSAAGQWEQKAVARKFKVVR